METHESPLVLTKLRAPKPRARTVQRARLLETLADEGGAGLVLVCAPAGYGKTTLLAEWAGDLRRSGARVAWYGLDPSDDSPAVFGAYLVASLSEALGAPEALVGLAQLLRTSAEIDLQTILPGVINAVAARDQTCWLILDDYHLIGAPAIHTALAYLIEHRPENLRVALGSRSDPPLPLARLRARGQLLEVRAAALRFTPAETARFLNEVMRLDLSPELVAALEERTEGWVAGLQLAALSLAGRADPDSLLSAFTGSHHYLVDYLLDEVFDRQSPEVQAFLLCASVLERLSAELCDEVFENRESRVESRNDSRFSTLDSRSSTLDSRVILDYLDRSNLFLIPLDEERTWYRFHHLFRDFLRARLEKAAPERIPALHQAACAWYARNGSLREAARHAFASGDWESAAAFVEEHAFTLIIHSEIATLHEWCAAFPEEVLRAHPMLGILQCWPWVFRFRRENRAKIEARLAQAEQAAAAQPDPRVASDIAEHAAVVRAFLNMAPDPAADARGQLALAEGSLENYPEDDASRFSGLLAAAYAHMALHEEREARAALQTAQRIAAKAQLYFGMVESTFHLARLAHARGELRQAVAICQAGQAQVAALLAHPEQELPGLGSLEIATGCALVEQDRLEEAEPHLLKGLELVGTGMNAYYPMLGCAALFHLYSAQGRAEQAGAALARLEGAWPDVAFYTQGLRVVQALRAAPGDPAARAAADDWRRSVCPPLGEPAFLPGLGPFGAAEVYYQAGLAWAEIQIALGPADAALPALRSQAAAAERRGLNLRVGELSLLESLAAQSAEQPAEAWEALERALSAARGEAFPRVFERNPAARNLLFEASRQENLRGALEAVLARLQPPEGAAQPAPAATSPGEGAALDSGERLSERELEVLRLMAEGASNQAIAEQLVITVGTVKSHINHILGKLSARNRTEAVARARSLGLPGL